MRLDELRSMFPSGTKIYAVNNIHNADEEVIGVERLEIKNLLYGSSGFCNLDIRHIKAVGNDELRLRCGCPMLCLQRGKSIAMTFTQRRRKIYDSIRVFGNV